MGYYRSSVRCSYCGGVGHNRLGCPERKKLAREDPDSYVGRQVAREQESMKRRVENRACSYCGESGHNRRGCKLLKEDAELIKSRQAQYLKHFAEVTSSVGLVPGALVRVPVGRQYSGSDPKGYVGMVTSVNWGNVDFLNQDTDLNYGWRERENPIFNTRVISSYGFPEGEEDYWNEKPKFNQKRQLSPNSVHRIIEDAFGSEFKTVDEGQYTELLSPAPIKITPPQSAMENLLTPRLNKRFHINPDKRSDQYDKARTRLEGQQWCRVRPQEHFAAKEKV